MNLGEHNSAHDNLHAGGFGEREEHCIPWLAWQSPRLDEQRGGLDELLKTLPILGICDIV